MPGGGVGSVAHAKSSGTRKSNLEDMASQISKERQGHAREQSLAGIRGGKMVSRMAQGAITAGLVPRYNAKVQSPSGRAYAGGGRR